MVVCVPVREDGSIDLRWGRAQRVAIAEVRDGQIDDWQEFDVGWDALHGAGGDGSHHARVARFLLDHHVDMVVAHHMGPGMLRMLKTMNIARSLDATGDARTAVLAAVQPD